MKEISFSEIPSKQLPDIVIQRIEDQVTRVLGDEVVILNLENNTYHGLDGVGTRIWDLISEQRRIGEVLEILLEMYEVEHGRCESDLLELLQNLSAEGLIKVTF